MPPIRLPASVVAELHERLTGSGPDSVYEAARSRCRRYEIEVLPVSGAWRVTDVVTGRSVDGESLVETSCRAG